MIKKIIALTLITSWVGTFAIPAQNAFSASSSLVTAPSAILIDGISGKSIFSKSPHIKRPQASTTKIMTAMVVLDQLRLNDIVVVSKKVEPVQPSKIYLKGGERYYVRDLIYAILLKSANDAAEALAIQVAGSVPAFCAMMNKKAKALGAKNTQFKTPNGLPAKGQYSTAYDLAIIMREAERYPFIVEALSLKEVTIKSLKGRSIALKSHNKMLWSEKYDVIGKTGYTRSSSYCFVGRVNEKYKDVYLSLLGSSNRTNFWADVRKLCGYPSSKMVKAIQTNQRIWAREEVFMIQQALLAAGYDAGAPDGEFSFQTLAAVEAFQRDHKLSVDGVVGKQTMSLLRNSR
ncbi:MAG TPA: peptidoglycan-binding protein [Candidatus Omnitrophota bacterium]|nr:peptidoglycan-binding protein [Candidatus Omnitrophota bacterium]